MIGQPTGSRRAALAWLFGGGATAALLTAKSAQADGGVPLDKVPKVVKDAAERVLPKAKWHSATKAVDEDKTAYELDGTDRLMRDVTVMVTDKGKVVEIETVLKRPDNVSEKALAAIREKWPRFEPTETHRLRQGENLKSFDDGDLLFDMRGTIIKDRYIQVQVTEDGKILESTVEVPTEKVPAVVMGALKEKRPKFEVGTIYALRENEKILGYHFEGKGPKGRDRTISVTPDGKQVEVVE